jgi:hypothetical protein
VFRVLWLRADGFWPWVRIRIGYKYIEGRSVIGFDLALVYDQYNHLAILLVAYSERSVETEESPNI